MVIGSGATIGGINLDGFDYYEGDLWGGGFDGCVVDSSEPAPQLLDAIQAALFNCSFDSEAAAVEARAEAFEESGSGFRLRTDAELRTAGWAVLAPQLCTHTAAAQERTIKDLAAVVAQYEVPWPWVGAAWTHSDVQFVEDLAAACGGAAVFDLNPAYDVFNPEASRNPPPAACAGETRILVSHSVVGADRDALVEPLLQVLARVWNRTTDDEDWATIQAAFAEHLAGCRSARAATPEGVREGVLADTMVSTAGGLVQYGAWYHYADDRWVFEGCDAGHVRTRGLGSALAAAVEAALFRCPYEAEAAEAAWAESDPSSTNLATISREWEEIAHDVCGADA